MLNRTQYAVISAMFAFAVPSISAEKVETPKASGIVTDIAGRPLAGVVYWISAIEEWGDGKWELVYHSGIPREYTTDEDGRFEIEFRGRARYDLQFIRGGYAPAFLFQVSEKSNDLHVRMEKGMPVKGEIELKGKKNADFDAIIVFLRLPNPRGLWYKKTTLVDHKGQFEFLVTPPPDVPGQEAKYQWQLVCAGETVILDVVKGTPVDEVVFEIATKSRTRPPKAGQMKGQPRN
jgi:hypothetical protein